MSSINIYIFYIPKRIFNMFKFSKNLLDGFNNTIDKIIVTRFNEPGVFII